MPFANLPIAVVFPEQKKMKKMSYIAYNFFFLATCHEAYGVLVPQPDIKHVSPTLEAQSLNHWTTREVPITCNFNSYLLYIILYFLVIIDPNLQNLFYR